MVGLGEVRLVIEVSGSAAAGSEVEHEAVVARAGDAGEHDVTRGPLVVVEQGVTVVRPAGTVVSQVPHVPDRREDSTGTPAAPTASSTLDRGRP